VSFSPDNVHETGVSPGGQSGSPIVAAEAEQVERTRRKTWLSAQSEVFVPYRHRAHPHPGRRDVRRAGDARLDRSLEHLDRLQRRGGPYKDRFVNGQVAGVIMSFCALQHPAQRSHEQPIAAAKPRPANTALEYGELMTKDQDLEVVVPILGRAACERRRAAAAVSRRQQRAWSGPPSERRSDRTNVLTSWRSEVSVPFSRQRRSRLRVASDRELAETGRHRSAPRRHQAARPPAQQETTVSRASSHLQPGMFVAPF
jgi:hypothetical protein